MRGRGGAHLHPPDVDGKNRGEEKHLQEEVGHQPHDSKQTELLKTKNSGLCKSHICIKRKRKLFVSVLSEMRRWQYLDSWNQGKISNQDDAQLSGHVLHDRPALITKTCTHMRETGICDGRSKKEVSHIGFTLSDAEFDLQVDGGGHH